MSGEAGLVVIGAGVAGTGAALGAAAVGARVTVIDAGTGGSTLWTGAVDLTDTPSDETVAMATSLGVVLHDAVVATTTGRVRQAGGHDAALLDLLPLAKDGTVGVVRCDRPGWDADALVRTAGAGLVGVDATILRMADERLIPDADFAARHDDCDRLAWLADRLRIALSRTRRRLQALLLPPSLGLDASRAHELSQMVGVTCGEAMGMPGGPAGLRFERSRDRALRAAGVEVISGRAESVEARAHRWVVRIDGKRVDADAVVLAAGGVLGGGLEYRPSEATLAAVLPPAARIAFRCTIDVPARIGAGGRPLDVPGSLFGIAPESIAWPLARTALMDRVGILCDEDGRVAPNLYAAGEIVADAPRTWYSALDRGARAGQAAAGDAFTVRAEPPPSLASAPASRA